VCPFDFKTSTQGLPKLEQAFPKSHFLRQEVCGLLPRFHDVSEMPFVSISYFDID
jgi:hypothetical protein